jgi:hypothetical protein
MQSHNSKEKHNYLIPPVSSVIFWWQHCCATPETICSKPMTSVLKYLVQSVLEGAGANLDHDW